MFTVVGAGFSGSVVARQLAEAGHTVIVYDRRPHIGGNAYDYLDPHGVLIHKYGPHLFHTNSKRIFEYLSRFTHWRFYEYRVKARLDGVDYPLPVNRTTLDMVYGPGWKSKDIGEPVDVVTSKDSILHRMGSKLCSMFFEGYTRKQWGLSLHDLDHSVADRIPIRFDDDDRYSTDTYQFVPNEGYTGMFRNLLDHPKIHVILGMEVFPEEGKVIWTGPIDDYFGHRFGMLPYRSLRFEPQHYSVPWLQPCAGINYPDAITPFTRVVEYKHITGQEHPGTTLVYEYPSATGEPFYPIPHVGTHHLYQQYADLAKGLRDVVFVGRLAQYRYYNMDQAVGAALKAAERILS